MMLGGAEIAIIGHGWDQTIPGIFNPHSLINCLYSVNIYKLLCVTCGSKSASYFALVFTKQLEDFSPMMMMLTHGLWIIICCKHHGEIICFVSKQAAASCICPSSVPHFVSRLWEISALWVSRPPERGGLFCMIERERVAWCYNVSKKLCLIVLSPSLLCIQGFMPFASFCNLSIVSALPQCCSFVRSAEYVLLCGLH